MNVRHQFPTPNESALVRAATIVTPSSGVWQFNEAAYGERSPCDGAVRAFDLGCTPDYGDDGKPSAYDDTDSSFTEFCRFLLTFSDQCSISGDKDWHDVETYARNGLQYHERVALEQLFWGAADTPLTADDAEYDLTCALTYFDDPDVNAVMLPVPTQPYNTLDAISALEFAMFPMVDSPFIHVPSIAINGIMDRLVTDAAGNLRTILGSYIIPGAGYDGSGIGGASPDEDTVTIFATGEVKLLRGEVTVVGDQQSHRHLGQNTVQVIAERAWGVWWDPCPGVLGAVATYRSCPGIVEVV